MSLNQIHFDECWTGNNQNLFSFYWPFQRDHKVTKWRRVRFYGKGQRGRIYSWPLWSLSFHPLCQCVTIYQIISLPLTDNLANCDPDRKKDWQLFVFCFFLLPEYSTELTWHEISISRAPLVIKSAEHIERGGQDEWCSVNGGGVKNNRIEFSSRRKWNWSGTCNLFSHRLVTYPHG